MGRKFAASSLILALIFISLGADKPQELHFLSKGSIDIIELLPDPPTANSDETRREFQTLYDAQQTRTPKDIERAQAEDKLTVFAFKDVIGEWFTAENCPQTAALFEDMAADSKYFSNMGKDHWNRPRPYVASDRVKPVTKKEIEGSYPSGHATRGTIFAEVLAGLFPEQREALLERGREIGWDRVLAGVHYPSDVAAGRVLGHDIARQMLKSETLQSRLDTVKSELAKARQLAQRTPEATSAGAHVAHD